MSTTWTPLHEAFEHVLQHERSRELTEYRLRRVLGTRKSGPQVRCRAGVSMTPMRPQRERGNVMLPGDFWLLEVDHDGQADGAIVNWQEDSARLPASHPFAPWLAYRIEVCREDLLAIWTAPPEPEDASKQHKAAEITRLVAERAAKLKGIHRDPITQAWAEVAQETGHASGPALSRWVRRKR